MADLAQPLANNQAASSKRRFIPQRFQPHSNRVRLQTLVRLRWLAVVGQTVALLVVYFGFKFPLPLGLCLGIVAISAWLNIFLTLKYPANLRLRNRYAALLLAHDILQLTALIALTAFFVKHREVFKTADRRNPYSRVLLSTPGSTDVTYVRTTSDGTTITIVAP